MLDYLTIKNKLNSPIFKESILGVIFNVLSVFFSVLQIAFLIKYLGKTDYGIWVTIYSICNWISFLDGGFGNGMRNELTSSLVKKDKMLSKKIISTGYISITFFLILLFIIIIIVNYFIDWNTVLKDNSINYNIFSLFVFGFFFLQMTVKLINKVYFSFNKASLSFITPFVSNLVIFLAVFALYKFDIEHRMWNVGIVFSLSPILVFIIFSLHFFLISEPNYKPKIKYFEKSLVNKILSKGILFFLIQMSASILQSLTPFFITLWFIPEITAEYQVAIRYYSVLILFQNIILQTLWSPITKSYIERNIKELKNFIKIKAIMLFILVFILMVMWIFSPYIYKLWLGKDIIISGYVNLMSAIFIFTLVISKIFTNFLNATGNIKIQSIVSIIIIILYYPLIFFAVKILNLGIGGLILAPAIFFILQTFVALYEMKKLVTNK